MSLSLKARPLAVIAGLSAVLLGLSVGLGGCAGARAGGDPAKSVDIVGFSVLEKANEAVMADFEKTPAGKGVGFTTSYGASGDQSRAVEKGLKADVVHFSLESDVTRLVAAGLVADDWKSGPHQGIASQSVVAFVVRKGNPKGIESWADIVKPGVGIITPNPGSSGSARWNILAAFAHASEGGKDDAAGTAFVKRVLANAVALPGSGREATSSFEAGNGDVLLSYENEAILARQHGADFDYVVPADTLLIENPAAITTQAGKAAESFLSYLGTEPAQRDYAERGFRPLVDVPNLRVEGANDPAHPFPAPARVWTIAKDFGGWAAVNEKFFADKTGIVTRLLAEAGRS